MNIEPNWITKDQTVLLLRLEFYALQYEYTV